MILVIDRYWCRCGRCEVATVNLRGRGIVDNLEMGILSKITENKGLAALAVGGLVLAGGLAL